VQKSDGKKKQKCKNCEGKGTLEKGDKVVRCQRCDGTGSSAAHLRRVPRQVQN
jgi:DnaJ-class molecular chaperone